jgi:hypothetical protein
MTRRSRASLKNYFTPGSRPSKEQFDDLIDSALIMDDEGFSKTPADGLKVLTTGAELGLISFQRQQSPLVDWSMGFLDGAATQLALKPGAVKDPGAPPIITFQSGGAAPTGDRGPANVRIRAEAAIGVTDPGPQPDASAGPVALDVAGVVCADGRIGRQWQAPPADGKFHAITPNLQGCVAFEVMAGVSGVSGGGRYALLHAVAMNVYNPSFWDNLLFLKKRIRSQHAYYSRGSDRLQLSWVPAKANNPNLQHGMEANFTLQIRTRSTYLDTAPDAKIKVFVTRLWGDGVWPAGPAAAGSAS